MQGTRRNVLFRLAIVPLLLAALVPAACAPAPAARAADADVDAPASATPVSFRADADQPVDRWFTTTDGVRLHYIEAGAAHPGPVVLFIPGWTMPAAIFAPQIAALSRVWHVAALDPRGQGDSQVPATGYTPQRRGADIGEMIARFGPPVVLVGWSLGVLDSLAYVHQAGDGRLAGLVLIDNSVGEEPAPPPPGPRPHPPRPLPAPTRDVWMRGFVRSMFHRPQDEAYLEQLAEIALRTPPAAATALLSYPVPRSYWREALYMVHRPVLYVVTPKWQAQAANVALHDPEAEIAVFADAGHALFIDDEARFDALLADFLARRIAGAGTR